MDLPKALDELELCFTAVVYKEFFVKYLTNLFLISFLGLSVSINAFAGEIDRTIETTSSLSPDDLQLTVLPSMRVGLKSLLEKTYKCKKIVVETDLDVDMYSHDIVLTVQGQCPTNPLKILESVLI